MSKLRFDWYINDIGFEICYAKGNRKSMCNIISIKKCFYYCPVLLERLCLFQANVREIYKSFTRANGKNLVWVVSKR